MKYEHKHFELQYLIKFVFTMLFSFSKLLSVGHCDSNTCIFYCHIHTYLFSCSIYNETVLITFRFYEIQTHNYYKH